MSISSEEGWEKPAILVTILGGPAPVQFRAYKWGMMDGHPFFDLCDDQHVELFNGPAYFIQVPSKGCTIDENFRHRKLQKVEPMVTLQ